MVMLSTCPLRASCAQPLLPQRAGIARFNRTVLCNTSAPQPPSPTPASGVRPAGPPGPRPGIRPPGPPGPPGARPGPPGQLLGPDGQPLEVVSIEKAGEEAWAGVAQLDKGESDVPFDTTNALILAAGDLALLLVFAATGRASHGEPVDVGSVFGTAFPFIAGWFLTAPFLGGFSKDALKSGVPKAALTAVKCWAVGVPLGIAFRSIARGYMPATSFIVVSMVANLVILGGWRSAYASTQKPEEQLTPAQRLAMRRDKKGNPLEFLSLLKSLTTRW